MIADRSLLESGIKHSTEIRIHAGLPPGVITPAALGPTKTLLRIAGAEDFATPLYASSLLHDLQHKDSLLHLHKLEQALPDRTADSFLALWRIWASRRGIRRERGGSAWFAGLLLGWVVNGCDIGGQSGDAARTKKVKGLGRGLGHWGALRAAWESLGELGYQNLCEKIYGSDPLEAHTDFAKNPVFLDTHAMDQAVSARNSFFCQSEANAFPDFSDRLREELPSCTR